MKCSRLPLIALLALVLMASPSANASPGTTERVSVASDGAQADAGSFGPAISADGRFVAFGSGASNLVSGDTNGVGDIFVHDRLTGTTERVSVDSEGNQANDYSSFAAISADGRFVAFESSASNLVASDTNSSWDIFVHDRQTGVTERVSVDSAGNEGDGGSPHPTISADGRFVAFDSYASNLVSGDTNGRYDIFVHDRQTGVTERISVDSAGNEADCGSDYPAISADALFVTFSSCATNLAPEDTNSGRDVFVHDRQTGTTELISVNSAGSAGSNFSFFGAAITGDGRFVSFNSYASNLVPDDTNGVTDIFVRDRQTATTTRVSMDSSGDPAECSPAGFGWRCSAFSDISGDGRYVAFSSIASDLVPGDTNDFCDYLDPGDNCHDIFVHDRQTGITVMVSVDAAGDEGNGPSGNFFTGHAISADGRYVAFYSDATDLVAGDTNDDSDIFIHDLGDADADGHWDPFDNCPDTANPGQENSLRPETFAGDLCEDFDGDLVLDIDDNCPDDANPAQTNSDAANEAAGFRLGTGSPPPALLGDALGDACDTDDDNDGFLDADERAIYGVGPGSDEEGIPCRTATVDDPWPLDLPSPGLPDRVVDIQDLTAIVPFLFQSATGNERFNLFVDGVIDVQDLNALVPFLFQSCEAPP